MESVYRMGTSLRRKFEHLFGMIRILSVVIILLQLQGTIATQNSLNIVADDNGTYNVVVDGKIWLRSGPAHFYANHVKWSTSDKNHTLTWYGVDRENGTDPMLKEYRKTTYHYLIGNDPDTAVKVNFSVTHYASYGVVVFTQYANMIPKTSSANFNTTISGFPSFRVQDGDEALGFLSFGGYMFGDTDRRSGVWNSLADFVDGIIGGPLVIFNQDGGKAIVISPMDNFMASSLWRDDDHVTWGIMGGVNQLPIGFSYSTVLAFSNYGINSAIQWWGNILRQKYDTDSTRYLHISSDISLNYLGYWTDNGGYYYYHTEKNKTYEDTLLDVVAYSKKVQLPFRYLQLDSWWYPKDRVKAVTKWEAKPDIFPDGLSNLNAATGLPFVAHNRYWSKASPYAKLNGGKYNFIIEDLGSLPDDQTFWNDLLRDAKRWGLQVYEQDWLNVQFGYSLSLQTDLNLGSRWLTQMATAALSQNLTIQYCMANPRHALQSLMYPVVTQARVSDDYHLLDDQWKIGVTSILADSLSLRPSKDTFWTTSVQSGNPFGKTEPYPDLEAVVSTLSMGPVGPSDMINGTNVDLLMKCCSKDGRLLKPSFPAKALDKQIVLDAFRGSGPPVGEIWSTYTALFDHMVKTARHYVMLFAADVSQNITIQWRDLKMGALIPQGVYFPYNDPSKWKPFDQNTSIVLNGCTKAKFCLYYFTPLLNQAGVKALFGEINKWVPVSRDRFIQMKNHVGLVIRGAAGENVTVTYLKTDGTISSSSCVFTTDGHMEMNITTHTCVAWSSPTVPSASPSPTVPSSTESCSWTFTYSAWLMIVLLFFSRIY